MNNTRIFQDRCIHKRGIFLVAVLVVALVASACGITLPVTKIQTGPTQTVDILIPLPEDSSISSELHLEFLTGELKLSPETSPSGYLVSGGATFNAADFEPQFDSVGAAYTVRQGDGKFDGIPINQQDLENEWDLQLAATPMRLRIDAGPYTGKFELGGLALEELAISEAGSDVTCTFSLPNQVEMSSFTYETGGSSLEIVGLANANFAQMTFTAGAGDYTLSFDGDLQREASVMIDAGLGTLNLIVPKGVNAQVTFDGGLTGIHLDSGWEQNGKVYTHPGSGPSISIIVKMGVGTLNLKAES
jgi:hypothetical protein